ncbi:hypothetical protein CspHIS471_0607960 [Cutaneotrichosporon sp. HIS471]|nr:hypothetical protein CspHIS471_0607960 [Cutaneotrichosporon sp. HIS471]
MAARIPQMYEVRRAHAPSPAPPSPPSPHSPNTNPFATPNASVTNLAAPATNGDRNSTNLSSIGGLLMSADDWERDEPKPRNRARSSTIVQPQSQEYSSMTLHARVQSFDGDEMEDNHRSFFSDVSDIAPARVGANPPRVTPGPPPRGDSLPKPNGVNFPMPAPSPHANQVPLPQQQRPFPTQPASILQPTPQHPAQRSAVQVALPVFAGAAPVSPMLAAPPRAHFSPMAPSPSPSNDNASIRGHDYLREKNATFREGEEEVFTPFSPRARQAGPRTRAAGRKSIYSTVDFWKRLSTVAKSHDKESSFLAERRRTIWRNPMFVVPLILTLIAVAAIIVYVVVKVSSLKSV